MRTFLKTEIPLVPNYEDAEIKLCQARASLTLRLLGGPGRTACEAPVGLHKPSGRVIVARAEFAYRTDLFQARVDVCGSSPEPGLWSDLALSCDGQEIARVRLHSGALMDSPLLALLRETLADAQVAIRDAAVESGISVGARVDPGAYADRHFVLRDGVINHIFDPEADDFDVCKTVPVTSTALAAVALGLGAIYCNVIGSTHDPKHGFNTWIAFWLAFSGVPLPAGCCYSAPGAAAPPGPALVNNHLCSAAPLAPIRHFSGNHSLPVPGGVMPAQNVAGVAAVGPMVPSMYIILSCTNSNHRIHNTFTVLTAATAVEIQQYMH